LSSVTGIMGMSINYGRLSYC